MKTIDDMSAEQLQKNATRAMALLGELESLLPGLVLFTKEERGSTDGRIRGPEEENALRAVLAVMQRAPGAFEVLADKDDGRDPTRVETDLLAARLDRRAVLVGVAERATSIAQRLEDTVLDQGERSKPLLLSAYGIARSLAQHDDAIRSQLAPALDYYGAIGRKAARTRAENKNKT